MGATAVPPNPSAPTYLGRLRPITTDEYRRMIDIGVLSESEHCELLEGHLVVPTPRGPPHDGTHGLLEDEVDRLMPAGWQARSRLGLTLEDSQPEPDIAVVREDPEGYYHRHPNAADVAVLMEVADSSLESDRVDKGRIYARAGVAEYWIVNVPDRQIEVYTQPTPTGYADRQNYTAGAVSLTVGGVQVGAVPLAAIFP